VQKKNKYRDRAREMRRQAKAAQTKAMQDAYLAIAANWDALADKAAETESKAGDDPEGGN
jgi:hypothetical protein